ncbi:MAG: hypothetical protein WC203_03470 [Candidatus Bathyarchaeia archaeon]
MNKKGKRSGDDSGSGTIVGVDLGNGCKINGAIAGKLSTLPAFITYGILPIPVSPISEAAGYFIL